MTAPFLIIDNTRPIDPTVPDLYEGIAGNDHGDMPAGVAIAIALGMLVRRLGFLGWIAVGVCVGLVI